MKIIFIDEFNKIESATLDYMPTFGQKVGCFNYSPLPTVTEVILLPHPDDFSAIFEKAMISTADAIVLCK